MRGILEAEEPEPEPASPGRRAHRHHDGRRVALLNYGHGPPVPIAFALFLSFALRPFVSLLERARCAARAAILRSSS